MNVKFASSFLLLTIVAQVQLALARVVSKHQTSWGSLDTTNDGDDAWLPDLSLITKGENVIKDPAPDFKELREKINGGQFIFNPRYMALKNPQNKSNLVDSIVSKRELMLTMPDELKSQHFALPGSERELGQRASRKFRLWLWNLSYCPLLEKWDDFGESFWPRYINRGECAYSKTCSYPKGMKCAVDKLEDIFIYWWKCDRKMLTPKTKHCSWKIFILDVITSCKCKC